MQLGGQIQDIAVTDLFQYLLAGKKTGTLVLQNGDRKAHIYFKEGQIIHAVSPNRTTIGDWLIKTKDINVKVLRDALDLQAGRKKGKPLGQILVEIGAVSREVLRRAIVRQIKEVIVESFKWSDGDFMFEHNEIVALDDINLNPMEALQGAINTQQVLVESAGLAEEKPNGKKGGYPQASNRPASLEAMNDEVPFFPFKGLEPGGSSKKFARSRILFFTEDGLLRNLLRLELEKIGLEMVTPVTVQECAAKLKDGPAEVPTPLVVLDDGGTGARRLSVNWVSMLMKEGRSRARGVTVAVLTQGCDYETTARLYEAGAAAAVSRPERGQCGQAEYAEKIRTLGLLVDSLLHRFSRSGMDEEGNVDSTDQPEISER